MKTYLRNLSHRKNFWLAVVVMSLSVFGTGCALTDYDGIPLHQTASEARLWGVEVSFEGFDPALDGTYSYTVKYDRRTSPTSPVTITSYRNPVVGSFSRDGVVDRDGDDIQGRAGILGGKFRIAYVAVDKTVGTCEFEANLTQLKIPEPGALVCDTVEEEVDRDLDLQADFSSLDDLFSKIWSGAISDKFTMELTSFDVDGVNVPLSNPISIQSKSNGVRPATFTVKGAGSAGKDLIQGILNNTQNKVPVTIRLNFAGGMSVTLPRGYKVAFNHDVLWGLAS